MLNHFDKLNSDEANYLKKIINIGGKIKFYITIKVKGDEYLKNLKVNLNGSILPDLNFQYLKKFVIHNAIIKKDGFYFPELSECRIFNSNLPSKPVFINLHTKIFELIIRSCNLATIPKLDNMKYLRLLNLSNNKINSIKSLHNDICCDNIQQIDLSHNKISNLYDFKPFSYCFKIRDLYLSFNQINSVNITYSVPKLTNLILSNNNIYRIDAIKNLPSLKRLNLSNSYSDNNFDNNFDNNSDKNKNNISRLENLSNLPNLETINITGNPISHISGLEFLPKIKDIGYIHLKSLSKKQIQNMINYIHEIELTIDDDDILNISILGPFPKYSFKINKHIKLILIKNLNNNKYETKLLVDNENFIQCRHLFIIPSFDKNENNSKNSIDDFSDELNNSTESIKPEDMGLLPEEMFWGHCSNLQAWNEHNYDTKLLHRSLAFPLLEKLTEIGDPIAKKVFKEEIAKRYTSGNKNVQEFLKNEGYLNYLSKIEFESLKK